MKPTTLSKAVALADKYFSQYVRLYSADYSGMVKCVTCGAKKHWKNIDAGHFMSRIHKNTRWEEKNCSPQDSACNKWGAGKQYEHGKYLDGYWGEGTADEMMAMSKMTVKLDVFDVLEIAKKYRYLALIEAEKRGIDLGEPKTNRILDSL